jgi:hypothetical protein
MVTPHSRRITFDNFALQSQETQSYDTLQSLISPYSLREHNPMALYRLKAAYSIREHNPMAPAPYSLTGTQHYGTYSFTRIHKERSSVHSPDNLYQIRFLLIVSRSVSQHIQEPQKITLENFALQSQETQSYDTLQSLISPYGLREHNPMALYSLKAT